MNAEQQKILTELQDALTTNDTIKIADSISDLLHVVYGTDASCVIDVEPIYDDVNRTNIIKVKPRIASLIKQQQPLVKPEIELQKLSQKQEETFHVKCFYHSADLDGYCSGALVKLKYPQCELIGIDYMDEFPWSSLTPSEKVFMVDFSLPTQDMFSLEASVGTGNLIWIDHHKSAIEDFQKTGKMLPGIQKIGIGACSLVFDYLFPEVSPTPTFVKLLAEYDVFNHSDPRTLPFQYGMRSHNTNPENQPFWKELLSLQKVQQIVEDGKPILAYNSKSNELYVKSCSFEIEFDGLKFIAANKLRTNHQLFDSVWDETKYDAMLCFGYQKGQWTVSMYSTKQDVDVSLTAKKWGGGGHKKAAGFSCKELPFSIKASLAYPNYGDTELRISNTECKQVTNRIQSSD